MLALLRIALLVLVPGSGPSHASERAPASASLRERVETLRAGGDARIGAGSPLARSVIASLYEQRGFAPLWTDPARRAALLAAIEASSTHGLDPRDYHAETLARPLPAAGTDAGPQLAERELLQTDAFMRLAYHLRFGKADPRALSEGWNFARSLDGADPVRALAAAITADDPAGTLESLAPGLPLYRELRDALAGLRDTERRGGWPLVDGGPKLEPGASGPRVRQLRRRLHAGGELPKDAGSDDYDAATDAAVRRFQSRHGLAADGVVGPVTLAALNAPVSVRIGQVRSNLERLRWVARELAGDYLLVDIAGFSAQLWLHDAIAWQARVVVGRPFRTTPEFRATMKSLVVNPDWNVPPTILREDVLPRASRDPGYLAQHHMRVLDRSGRPVDPVSIDWAQARDRPRSFPYQIVQAPGPDNPLGAVKFMFPNEHSVYLHDTPSRMLFERAVRAFSSGCIRVEKPRELAVLLLDDPQRWSMDQLQEAIATGQTRTLPVRRQVPVLLLYFTATVSGGQLQFRPDLYGRDGSILRALAEPFRYAPVDAGRATRS